MKGCWWFSHDWEKWGEIVLETFTREPHFYDDMLAYNEKRLIKMSYRAQYRTCQRCGKKQRRVL